LSLDQKGAPGLVPAKLVHQFYGPAALQTEDALDPGPVHYGHFEMFQLRPDLGKSQQPFGFRRHFKESPNFTMWVHSCAKQVRSSLMIIPITTTN